MSPDKIFTSPARLDQSGSGQPWRLAPLTRPVEIMKLLGWLRSGERGRGTQGDNKFIYFIVVVIVTWITSSGSWTEGRMHSSWHWTCHLNLVDSHGEPNFTMLGNLSSMSLKKFPILDLLKVKSSPKE